MKNNELTGGEEKSVADDTGGFSLSADNTLLYHLLFCLDTAEMVNRVLFT